MIVYKIIRGGVHIVVVQYCESFWCFPFYIFQHFLGFGPNFQMTANSAKFEFKWVETLFLVALIVEETKSIEKSEVGVLVFA